jgi:hypothetical protein
MKSLLYDASNVIDNTYVFTDLVFNDYAITVQRIFNNAVGLPMFICFQTLAKWNNSSPIVAFYTDEVLSLELDCAHGVRSLDVLHFFEDPCLAKKGVMVKVNKLVIDEKNALRTLSITQGINIMRLPMQIDPFIDENGNYHYVCVPLVKENTTNVEFKLDGGGSDLPAFKIKRENIIEMKDTLTMDDPRGMKHLVVPKRTAEHVALAIKNGKVNRLREY